MEGKADTTLIILLTLVFSCLVASMLALVTLLSKRKLLKKEKDLLVAEQQNQLAVFWAAAQAEENQKQRIAADLHDEVSPLLANAARNLNNELTQLEKRGVQVETLKKEVEAFAALSGRIREIAHGLVPYLFTSFGLLKSIEAVIKQTRADSGSGCEFQNNVQSGNVELLDKNKQLLVFRMCLEILTNISKHGRFDYLKVVADELPGQLVVTFAHDGKGISNNEVKRLRESSTGLGLKSLHSRALILNATLDYSTDMGVNYVKLTVPLNAKP